jgi:hypothetical protein
MAKSEKEREEDRGKKRQNVILREKARKKEKCKPN